MDAKEDKPPQAGTFTAVSFAGPGAVENDVGSGKLSAEKPTNTTSHDRSSRPSTPSDLEAPQEKAEQNHEAPPMSSLKTGLIMASLCVSHHRKNLPSLETAS